MMESSIFIIHLTEVSIKIFVYVTNYGSFDSTTFYGLDSAGSVLKSGLHTALPAPNITVYNSSKFPICEIHISHVKYNRGINTL